MEEEKKCMVCGKKATVRQARCGRGWYFYCDEHKKTGINVKTYRLD